jgi:hypothetical protein
VWLILALSGCDALWNIDKIPETGDGGLGGEGMVDSACTMVGKYGGGLRGGMFTHCVLREAGDVVLDHDFSTNSNTQCRYFTTGLSPGVTVCVIEGKTITVTGSVAVSGQASLVLAAADTLTIAGKLDLSQVTAAGSTPSFCGPLLGSGDNGLGGTVGGGGGGGSFKRIGGAGGMGTGAKAKPGMKLDFPDDIRGGCPGGDGGNGSMGTGGLGGGGGGAVYLIAKTAIHITQNGSINASGRPGTAGGNKSGGGAGGAGGFIGIDSKVFTYDPAGAWVFANGAGGGGGGAGSTAGGPPLSPPVSAIGGTPNGGPGAANDSQGVDGGTDSTNGGGGGGGGEGHLVIFTPDLTPADRAHLSPDPTLDL